MTEFGPRDVEVAVSGGEGLVLDTGPGRGFLLGPSAAVIEVSVFGVPGKRPWRASSSNSFISIASSVGCRFGASSERLASPGSPPARSTAFTSASHSVISHEMIALASAACDERTGYQKDLIYTSEDAELYYFHNIRERLRIASSVPKRIGQYDYCTQQIRESRLATFPTSE